MVGGELQGWLLRGEALKLYRSFLRTVAQGAPPASRGGWVWGVEGACRSDAARRRRTHRPPAPPPGAAELRGEVRREFERHRAAADPHQVWGVWLVREWVPLAPRAPRAPPRHDTLPTHPPTPAQRKWLLSDGRQRLKQLGEMLGMQQ